MSAVNGVSRARTLEGTTAVEQVGAGQRCEHRWKRASAPIAHTACCTLHVRRFHDECPPHPIVECLPAAPRRSSPGAHRPPVQPRIDRDCARSPHGRCSADQPAASHLRHKGSPLYGRTRPVARPRDHTAIGAALGSAICGGPCVYLYLASGRIRG